jgi:hypothetical protein
MDVFFVFDIIKCIAPTRAFLSLIQREMNVNIKQSECSNFFSGMFQLDHRVTQLQTGGTMTDNQHGRATSAACPSF